MVGNSTPPRELNSGKDHKLTRRRVMRLASSAGLSSAVVANMTVDDVKAADSGQVTISLDVDGQRKYTIAADYLELVQRANRVNRQVTKNHFRKNSIDSVATWGGEGEENPHVVVTVDRNNDKVEEQRGEIPEEKDGVEVKIHEGEGNGDSLYCENMDCVDTNENFPGGQPVVVRDENSDEARGPGTISPQIIESGWEWSGSSTAAHGFIFGGDCSSSAYVYHQTDLDQDNVSEFECYPLGSVDFLDTTRDIAFINMEDVTETDWNYKPSDRTEGVQISGTLSEEGVAAIHDEYNGDSMMHLYGAGKCHTNIELQGWNDTRSLSHLDDDQKCNDELYDQLVMNDGCILPDGPDGGDSGGIWFTPDPETDSWWALGAVSGWYQSWCREWYGPQGFSLDEVYDRAWR